MKVNIKRIYEPAEKNDGYRILVDRLWPRGLTKESAKIDLWLKEVAPSTELRQWFHAGEGGFDEFKARYNRELKKNESLDTLQHLAEDRQVITLLYAAKDHEHNHAVILKEMLHGD